MRQSASLAVLAVALVLCSAGENKLCGGGGGDFLVRSWEGVVKDKSLLDRAPAKGAIDNQADFAKLWRAWKSKTKVSRKVPTINFKDHIVYVYSLSGTRHQVAQFLSNKGQFRFVIVQGRRKPEPISGFHYQIVVVRRDKVKSFDPKPLVVNLKK
jgi:hypothetical protein